MSHPANDIYADTLMEYIAEARSAKEIREAIYGYYGDVLFSANTRNTAIASQVSVEQMLV